MNVLATQVGVHLGIGDLLAGELGERTVHRMVSTQWGKDVTVGKVVEWRVCHLLNGVGQQAEIQAAVQIPLLAQISMVDALHDGVVGHSSAPNAISNGNVELVGASGREDVGAQSRILVAIGTIHNLNSMIGIGLTSNEVMSALSPSRRPWITRLAGSSSLNLPSS